MGLLTHCGTELCTRENLANIDTPMRTESYVPVPHGDLAGGVLFELMRFPDMRVASEQYAVSKNGSRMFGVVELERDGALNDDYNIAIGIRNSHDKSFSLSFVAGAHVLVCDNLMLSGSVREDRKHTGNILEELPTMIIRMLNKTFSMNRNMDRNIRTWKDTPIDDLAAHDVICDSVRRDILPATKVKPLLREWHQPRHECFQPRSVWSLYNGFTEVSKGYSADLQPTRLLKLSEMFNERFPSDPSLN